MAIAVVLIVSIGERLDAQAERPPPRVVVRLTIDTLAFELPLALRPGGYLARRSTPATVLDDWRATTVARLESDLRNGRRALALASLFPSERRRRLAVPPPEALAPAEEELDEMASLESLFEAADLGIDMNARLELKFDQLRNARCTSIAALTPTSGCQEGFPTPTFGEQFTVRTGGVLGDRVHIDVDFDTEREFSANNNISVYYQGLEDEVLRRIDVGNVTFQAPSSRFITSGIPANSFGLQAEAQVGPLNVRSIVAQQKGSAVRTRVFTVGEATTQPVDFAARDLDFESGRFFFVVDPTGLPGYPAVDVLSLTRETLPLDLQIADVRVYRLRAQSGQIEANPNLGGIEAIAIRRDSPQRVGPFSWEILVEGIDYYLDPSSIWFALNTRAGNGDFLAVSYVTTSGDTVGTFPQVNGVLDTLELVYEPQRGPEVPTFFHEMRNVYRLGPQDVDRSTIDLAILISNTETPLDGNGTYLSRLGLSETTDPFTLDEFNRVFPRIRDPGGGRPIRDLFVVFPHLMPFGDQQRLEAGERNDSLYRTPTFLLRTQGPAPRFTLEFHYASSGSGDRTGLNLGAIQVRAGSEKLFVGDRQLVRNRDYNIDYALGFVTFSNPDSLFTSPTQVRVEFEENQLFDDAPKSIVGFSGTYSLGTTGDISAIGIFQRERTISTRPTLGFEPEALFIGGLSSDLHFEPNGITNFLNSLPLINTEVPSALDISGEVAISQPSAGSTGNAYVEDFEREPSSFIRLNERLFQLGSVPTSGRGLPATHVAGTGGFDAADAVPLVWQNLVQADTGILQFRPQDIDTTIVLAGTGITVETVLWLTLKPDTVGGVPDPLTGAPRWFRPHTPGPRWRSITQPLGGGSGVGVDLSRVEFLEFWLLEDADRTATTQQTHIVFDFGTVFEDAVGFAPDSFRVVGPDTLYSGFQFVGTGRLDSEKDPVTNVFNAQVDDRGIRGDRPDSLFNQGTGSILRNAPLCNLEGLADVTAFAQGNLLARCTRGNGFLDTEDLDGDNRLDVAVGTLQEEFVRYVFPVGDDRFFVRNGGSNVDQQGRVRTWRLYRIPFRQDTVQVGSPNLRQIQGLRMTMVAPDQGGFEPELFVAMARMRLIGAPWIKRAETPIAGLSGSRGELTGEVIVSLVTTEDTELGYTSPPNVIDAPQNVNASLGFATTEINEKSLRLLARGLSQDLRAEALMRFVDADDKNFLKYRNLRVWARGRRSGWEEDDLEFFIKVGRDEHNFYLYRTGLATTTWEPEVIIPIDRWLTLRAQVETAFLMGEPPSGAAQCGGDSTAYVACDGPFLVQMRDPGTSPPNLARVNEVAVGMIRRQETVVIDVAELWVDDIRLTDLINEPGVAAAVDMRLAAADVAEISVGYSRRDDQFRQLEEDPRYITDAAFRVGTLFRVDKLLPESWGYSIPLQVQHVRTDADPFYITQTDVLAAPLPRLRDPGSTRTSVDVAIQRSRRGESFVERVLLDPVSIRAHRSSGEDVSSLSTAKTRSRRLSADYLSTPRPRTFKAAPQFLIDLVDALPGFISNSEFAKALRTSRFRWNPARLHFSSALTDDAIERTTFRVPVVRDADTAFAPARRIKHTWRNRAQIDLRPFSTFGVRASYESIRDLQDYGDSTSLGRVLQNERRELLGLDVGFERARIFSTGLDVSPVLSTWLRPRLSLATAYSFTRDANARTPIRTESDSTGAFVAPEAVSNSRVRDVGATFDLSRLAQSLAGDSSVVARLLAGFLPANFSFLRELRSGFNDVVFEPGPRYQFGFGGLNAFRRQHGVLATSAAEINSFIATGGTRLPLGAQVRLNYRNGRNTFWFLRSNGQQRVEQTSREWPSLSASWLIAPGGPFPLISSINTQLRFRTIKRASLQPFIDAIPPDDDRDDALTEDNTTILSPSVTVIWRGGITTSASYTKTTGERVTSGNVTNADGEEWNGSLAFSFRAPGEIFGLRNQIRTTVAFNSASSAVCLIRVGSDECRTVADSRRREIDVRMDTGLSDVLRGGATFSYVLNDVRHTSNKLTQIVFSIYLDLVLFAGEIR